MARKNQESTVTFKAHNEEFNAAIREMNAESKTLNKQFKLVSEQLKDTGTESEKLSNTLGHLEKSQQLAADKAELTRKQLESVKAVFGENSAEARKMGDQLLDAETAYQRLSNQVNASRRDLERQEGNLKSLQQLFDETGKSVDDFADVIGPELAMSISKGTANSKDMEQAISLIAKEAVNAGHDIDKIKTALQTAGKGANLDAVRKDLQDVQTEAKKSSDAVDDFGDKIQNVAGAVVAGGGLAGAISQALDTSSLDTSIDISFDVPEESKRSVKDAVRGITTYGVDAESALEGVRRQWALNKDASDQTNSAIVKGAAAIAKAYEGIDFTELIQETNEISNELEMTNEDALGLVNSLLKLGFPPEQLDIIAEYGGQLSRAGYSAQEVQAIMNAGVETGTWNIDNLLDGLKEGRVRVAEFGFEYSDTLDDLIEGTNISGKQLTQWGKAVAGGGKEGSQAMYEIAKALNGVEDETKRNLIGVEIFGTMYEDQGKNITNTLINAKNATVDTRKNQELLNESIAKLDADPTVKMQQAFNDLKEASEPLLSIVADLVTNFANWVSENPKLAGTFTAIGAVLGIVGGAVAALTPVFLALSSAFGKIIPLVSKGSKAFTIIRTVLTTLSGPVGWVIGIVTTLGIVIFKNWDDIKEKTVEIWGFIKEFLSGLWEGIKEGFSNAWKGISNVASSVWDTVKNTTADLWNGLIDFLKTSWNNIVSFAQTVWGGLVSFFQTVWEGIKSAFNAALGAVADVIGNYFNSMKTGIETIWNGIKDYFLGAWEVIKNIFLGAILIVVDLLTGNWEDAKSHTEQIWGNIKGGLSNMWEGIKGIFSGALGILKGFITTTWDYIKNLTSTVWNNIKNISTSVWNAIKNGLTTTWNAIKNLASTTWNNLKNTVSNAWNSIKTSTSNAWNNIKNFISTTWNNIKKSTSDAVNNAKNAAVNGFNSLRDGVSNKINEAYNKVKEIWNKAVSFLRDIDLKQIGRDIISGLINGITGKATELYNKARDIANSIKNTISGALDIRSPSRVMMELGGFVGEGLAIGIEKMKKLVAKSANVLATAATPEVNAGKTDNPLSRMGEKLAATVQTQQAIAIEGGDVYMSDQKVGNIVWKVVDKKLNRKTYRATKKPRG